MPICVKTTVTDDPLAGMTPDQISDYISNVGGIYLFTYLLIYSFTHPFVLQVVCVDIQRLSSHFLVLD